ncbi:MAG: hypothetical protein R3190_09490, partial [Thermoanaerobaculia bacterium]|nr:hypothetical protein [Thermoanaerobaculia bacterium]
SSDGVGALLPQPALGLFLVLLPPCLATPLLAAYLVRQLDADELPAGRPQTPPSIQTSRR